MSAVAASASNEGWTDQQLQAAGIVPRSRVTSQYGDILVGERYVASLTNPEWEVWWFWRQGASKTGRKITVPAFLGTGQVVDWGTRKKLALADAMEMIPAIAQGAEAHRQYRHKA